MPRPASAGRELVDPRHEQLLAFRISQHPHGAAGPPAVFEVMVHRGPLLLVAVAPVTFPAPGGDAGALLLEPVRVPRQQRALAGIAELADHVGGAALVFDVQVHGPVTLLPAVLRHKGVLLPVGKSKKRHHLVRTGLTRHFGLLQFNKTHCAWITSSSPLRRSRKF